MGRNVQRRMAALVGVAGLAAALILGGCGAAEDSAGVETGSAADAPAQREGAPPAGADRGAEDGNEADAGAGAAADLRVDQRQIVYTGSMTVRVDDVEAKAARAVALVTGAGGFVGGDQRTSNDSSSEASLTLRVPADQFARVVDGIAELGEQQHRDIKTEDVTEESLDLDARITTQQARVASGRRLLAEADSLSDLVMLERELASREADLASLEAKKRRLADLVALSTITVTLLGPDAPDDTDDGPDTGFLVGLGAGWTAFLASMGVLLTVLGALLPWLVALGVPAFAVLWLVRRLGRRSRPAGGAAPTAAAGSPPPPPG
ncbi:DUF4349 domain-containing protein [Solwaraspora sp. WMMD1047]|uniref:DUF4349 domain-containing protein n=1 Tax=Solwaraspora sp. WMMD1047 TaxID=3016102 RepID=UPI002416116F|nr:DUF4349 domain-containing protein [Solwaraspora sp. WMMD1047]MDG4833343.1 DUF4349 domain-containing protein [Solwaraspora sp. WMMD1047]